MIDSRFSGITITSNELAKKDRMAQANIFLTAVNGLEKVLAFGLHDLDSIAAGITKLAEENLGVELAAYTKEARDQMHADAEEKALEQAQQEMTLKAGIDAAKAQQQDVKTQKETQEE